MFSGKRAIAALYKEFLIQCDVWPTLKTFGIRSKRRSGHSIRDIQALKGAIKRRDPQVC